MKCKCGLIRCFNCYPDDNMYILRFYQVEKGNTDDTKKALMDLPISALVLLDLQVTCNLTKIEESPGKLKMLITQEIRRRLKVGSLEKAFTSY